MRATSAMVTSQGGTIALHCKRSAGLTPLTALVKVGTLRGRATS